MDLTDDQTLAALDALTEHGDMYEFEFEGRPYVIRLQTQGDPDTNLRDDGDWFGQLSPWQGHHSDRQERPPGFDGFARKVWSGGDWMWWQPPTELKADEQAVRNLHDQINLIMEYGYSQVGVSLHETVTDSLGGEHHVEVRSAWIGGVEPFPDPDHIRDLVSDLLADLFSDR